jgi:hypothetical protein
MKISRLFIPALLLVLSCTNRDIPQPVDCAVSGLSLIVNKKNPPVSCDTPDGVIDVSATGGSAPYQYSIDGGAFKVAASFSGLAAGTFNVKVQDANKCEASLSITLDAVTSTLDLIATPSPNTSCDTPDGKIEVSGKSGFPPYQYQLNDKGYGSSTSFTGLNAGTYSIFIKDSKGCVKELKGVSVATTASTLDGSTELTENAGCSTPDGVIKVTARGGMAPYQYQLNTAAFGTASTFSGLSEGAYNITIKDAKGCVKVLAVSVSKKVSTLDGNSAIVADTGCTTSNGSISVAASGGQPPYQYQLNSNAFGNSSIFSALAPASYTITVKDSKGCTKTHTAVVTKSTTNSVISYTNDILPLLTANCNFTGCHTSGSRDFTTYDKVKAKRTNIKLRTGNGTMPPSGALSQAQIALIACWVDGGGPNN